MMPLKNSDTDDLDLGTPLPEPLLRVRNKPPQKISFWSMLSFLFTCTCVAMSAIHIGMRLNQQPPTPKTLGPVPETPIKEDIDCDHGKYAELCTTGYTSGPSLPLAASERCLAIGLVLSRSASEVAKQNAYFEGKAAYLTRKLNAAKAGETSEEENQQLIRAAERYDRQFEWYQKVFKKIVLLEKEHESKCPEKSPLHPDMTDTAIEEIAITEYASLWE
jgi:hypothetical protein